MTKIEDRMAAHFRADLMPATSVVPQAIEEIRALRAEVARLRAANVDCVIHFGMVRADLAAAERDAARYRWLAEQMTHVGHPNGAGWTLDVVLRSDDRDLDETIDAAIAGSAR